MKILEILLENVINDDDFCKSSSILAVDLLYLAADMANNPDLQVKKFAERAGLIAHNLLALSDDTPS